MRHEALGSVLGAVAVVAALVVLGAVGQGARSLPIAEPIIVDRAFMFETDRLSRNETLADMFERHGIGSQEAYRIILAAQPNGLNPRRIQPSKNFEFRYAIGEEKPDQMVVRLNPDSILKVQQDASGEWVAGVEEITWQVVREIVSGTIESSLNDAIHAAIDDSDLPSDERMSLIWDVADGVFGWVIDFTREIQPGDEFQMVYERLVSDRGEARYGRLLAARIQVRNTVQSAYVMSDEDNRNQYFDHDGRSLRRAFLRYPVEFRRISSTFGRRYHPVLRRWRSHLGTDFAADMGAPIRATADGVVIRAGRWGGYGNVVTIRHPKDIETRYAHMSRVGSGIRPGVRVSQGQTIGYVGMTGLASGPHVHYEFLKNGRQVNYQQVDLGDGDPISDEMRPEFLEVRRYLDNMMGLNDSTTQVAQAR
ncbi:MAG: M23 family metallopeptidase [Gemmatimonadota bacterium]|nr:M23 family metallopeptidase [Gemmatimonadota bacterium]MDH5805119.1 M23 family metallopeptidase [Gemmatimonadota bacterium]